MDSSQLEETLPIRASSDDQGDFGVTWLEPPPRSAKSSRRSDEDGDSELPAAALLHSCEYSPWGYFGNEGSDVDLYTYAALHIEIPPLGKGVRAAKKSATGTTVTRERSPRKAKPKHE